jgi:hypothetical protein
MRCHRTLRLNFRILFCGNKRVYSQEIITKEADLPALRTVAEYPTTTTSKSLGTYSACTMGTRWCHRRYCHRRRQCCCCRHHHHCYDWRRHWNPRRLLKMMIRHKGILPLPSRHLWKCPGYLLLRKKRSCHPRSRRRLRPDPREEGSGGPHRRSRTRRPLTKC